MSESPIGLSKVFIFNMSLGHCGINSSIGDVDENSAEANACRTYYDTCRRVLLEMMRWGFAEQQVALVLQGTPTSQWLFQYKYPTNCARINKIINPIFRTEPTPYDQIKFKINNLGGAYGKAILTDQASAVVDYNVDITDETLFSYTFALALSLFLASLIASPLRVDAKLKETVAAQWNAWRGEAVTNDRLEQQEDIEPESPHVLARN